MVMMEADYKRSMFQITETEYYRLKREQIDETAKREIEAADLAFNKFMAENDTKIKAIEDQTGSTKEYLRLLDLMKEARQSDLTPERYNEVKKAIDEVVAAMEGENKALLDELGLKKMIGDLDKARYDNIEAVTAATNKQTQAQRELAIQKRTNAQLKMETEGWASVFKLGTDEITAEYGKWGDNIQLMTKQMYSGLDNTFKNIFSGSFKGELDSAEEYFIAFCESIYNSLTELLSKQFVSGISGLISSFIGGGGQSSVASSGFSGGGFSFLGGTAGIASLLGRHTGGYVMHLGGFVPRFHSGGLNADEVPAVLQRGEYVVSKKGVAALDRLNNGELGGAPKININIIDNNNSHVTAETSSSGSNNIDLNMIIDQAVAKNLARSGSASNKTLKQGFGARERLVRR
jgi:lambda family phage tail tape measure protein